MAIIFIYSLGGVSAAIYAYLSEFNTDKHRAVVINYSTMFVSIAAIYMPGENLLYYNILYKHFNSSKYNLYLNT